MRPGTQYDVDKNCRVILNNNIVLNKIFACGIGYPVRTNDGKTIHRQKNERPNRAANPRADGFSLYMNIVGDILIKNLLPKDKCQKAFSHKIFPVDIAKIQSKLPTAFSIIKHTSSKKDRSNGQVKTNLVHEHGNKQKFNYSSKKPSIQPERLRPRLAEDNDLRTSLRIEPKQRMPKSSHSQNRTKI